jgi:hypothetical protein
MADYRMFIKNDPLAKIAQQILESTSSIQARIDRVLTESPTRKSFRMVADIIKTIKSPSEKQRMADHHAGSFSQQNPRFDHSKWHEWIGTHSPIENVPVKTEGKLDEISKDLAQRYFDKAQSGANNEKRDPALKRKVENRRTGIVRAAIRKNKVVQ